MLLAGTTCLISRKTTATGAPAQRILFIFIFFYHQPKNCTFFNQWKLGEKKLGSFAETTNSQAPECDATPDQQKHIQFTVENKQKKKVSKINI